MMASAPTLPLQLYLGGGDLPQSLLFCRSPSLPSPAFSTALRPLCSTSLTQGYLLQVGLWEAQTYWGVPGISPLPLRLKSL